MTANEQTPDLRFREFSRSWSIKKLGTLTNKVGSGKTPSGGSAVYVDMGIPLIRSQNVNNDHLDLSDVVFITPEIHNSMLSSVVLPNDVLLNITGASIGRSCVVPPDSQEANVNQHVCIIRLKNGASPDFLQKFLASWKGQKLIFQSQAGGAREGLNFENIRSFKIAFPEYPEQQKIARFLGAVDAKLDALRRKRALLAKYKRGVMQKLFSQEIRFRQDDGRPFPNWQTKKLGKFASFLKGKGISKGDIVEDGKFPCIRYGELYTDYSEVINNIISFTDSDPKGMILSKVNDVIIPASGEVNLDMANAACVQIPDVILGGDLNIIRGNFNGIFLAYYLNTAKRLDIARIAQGNSVVHLYSSQLSTLTVEVPCAEEQAKIASFLTAIDNKITAVDQQITHIETFKKGLLQQMFV